MSDAYQIVDIPLTRTQKLVSILIPIIHEKMPYQFAAWIQKNKLSNNSYEQGLVKYASHLAELILDETKYKI